MDPTVDCVFSDFFWVVTGRRPLTDIKKTGYKIE